MGKHHWVRIGSAGDSADSTVFQCRDCGLHSTTTGTPDDAQYPPCTEKVAVLKEKEPEGPQGYKIRKTVVLSAWTRKEALPFIRKLSKDLAKVGFGVALTGSVLTRGKSDNDLDLVVFPLNAAEVSHKALFDRLRALGWKRKFPRHIVAKAWDALNSTDIKTVEVWLSPDSRRVDLFLLR